MPKGIHDYQPDRRNADIKSVSAASGSRAQIKVSVFDSGFVPGDGVWEFLRVHDSGPPFLDRGFMKVRGPLIRGLGLTHKQLTQRMLDVLHA